MNKPVSYQEWEKQAGREDVLAAKILLSKFLAENSNKLEPMRKIIGKQLKKAFEKGLTEQGFRLGKSITIYFEEDASLKVIEVIAAIKATQGDTPLEYINMAFNSWQGSDNKISEWENASLEYYLQHWINKAKPGTRFRGMAKKLLKVIKDR